MHGLETIKKLNADLATQACAKRTKAISDAYRSNDIEALNKAVASKPVDNGQWKVGQVEGVVIVEKGSFGEIHLVDVRDPQNDTELVKFHKLTDIPKSVKAQVEAIASQRRRMICVAA